MGEDLSADRHEAHPCLLSVNQQPLKAVKSEPQPSVTTGNSSGNS